MNSRIRCAASTHSSTDGDQRHPHPILSGVDTVMVAARQIAARQYRDVLFREQLPRELLVIERVKGHKKNPASGFGTSITGCRMASTAANFSL